MVTIKDKSFKICVIGLGYVGLPLAVKLAKYYEVIGFDINEIKIKQLVNGIDTTGEIDQNELKRVNILFTSDEEAIKRCNVIIVAVPTPIDKLKNPDLSYLKSASQLVGRNLSKNSIVVYESTVYPGATEEICIPILEKTSGLKWKKDFWVGYSPERVNPGDKQHTIENIVKIVAGDTPETTQILASIYGKVIKAGIYKAPSIKVAEAAKVLENVQRDVNIALINEVSFIFNKLGIDTRDVIEAAATKWNFVRVEPGLVGGHCIPVDPYYLVYKSIIHGYVPELILAARAVNENVPRFIAHEVVKLLTKGDKKIKNSKILIFGITFKENIPDIRNSKVYDLIKELIEFGIQIYVYDPIADRDEVRREFNINLIDDPNKYKPYDAIILAVRHGVFLHEDLIKKIERLSSYPPVVIDIKGILNKDKAVKRGFLYWRL